MNHMIEYYIERDTVVVKCGRATISQEMTGFDDSELLQSKAINAMLVLLGVDRTDEREMEAIAFIDRGIKVSHDVLL